MMSRGPVRDESVKTSLFFTLPDSVSAKLKGLRQKKALRFLSVLTKLGAKWFSVRLRGEDPSGLVGGQGSSGAGSAVDPPCKVCNSPFMDQFLQEFSLLFNIMGFLLLHHPGG